MRVEVAAGVVVDDVADHGEPVNMADIHERLQLADLVVQVLERQWSVAAPCKQRIHPVEIRRELLQR